MRTFTCEGNNGTQDCNSRNYSSCGCHLTVPCQESTRNDSVPRTVGPECPVNHRRARGGDTRTKHEINRRKHVAPAAIRAERAAFADRPETDVSGHAGRRSSDRSAQSTTHPPGTNAVSAEAGDRETRAPDRRPAFRSISPPVGSSTSQKTRRWRSCPAPPNSQLKMIRSSPLNWSSPPAIGTP